MEWKFVSEGIAQEVNYAQIHCELRGSYDKSKKPKAKKPPSKENGENMTYGNHTWQEKGIETAR